MRRGAASRTSDILHDVPCPGLFKDILADEHFDSTVEKKVPGICADLVT